MGANIELINKVTDKQINDKIVTPKTGQTVRVYVINKDSEKERIQMFEGLVIKVQGSGSTTSICVRKISFGIGVERTFKIYSASIANIEIIKTSKIRRSRIYYMRNRSGKSARLKEIITKKPKKTQAAKSS